jgi:hypothetical protein
MVIKAIRIGIIVLTFTTPNRRKANDIIRAKIPPRERVKINALNINNKEKPLNSLALFEVCVRKYPIAIGMISTKKVAR